jgi:predicted dehydrogenase
MSASTRSLRVGHIGWLADDQSDSYETVAWCDTNLERLEKLRPRHPHIKMYSDYKDMLRQADLDVVVIATPNWLHHEMTRAFLEAGKHVFVEKPMGVTRAEIDNVLRVALHSGKNFAVDFEMRISPFARRVKELLNSGEFGTLRRMECVHYRGGWLEEGNGIWRTRPEQSGGLFLMEPIHAIDIFRFFAGGDVQAVQAVSGPRVLSNYRFPDNAVAHLFFENGILATLLTSHTLSAQVEDPADAPQRGHEMKMTFTCSRGTFSVDFWKSRILINRYETWPKGTAGTRVVFDRVEEYGDSHKFFHDIHLMRRDFLLRCAEGRPPLQDPVDAWKTHLVCLAAEESATGDFRRIALDYFRIFR